MLHITQPYTRLISGVNIPGEESHELVISIQPPGHTIAFRPKRSRQSVYISVVDCYLQAKYNPAPHMGRKLPATVQETDLKEEVVTMLKDEPEGLNIGELVAKLKEKKIRLNREQLGMYLKILKEFHVVGQRGLTYFLTQQP